MLFVSDTAARLVHQTELFCVRQTLCDIVHSFPELPRNLIDLEILKRPEWLLFLSHTIQRFNGFTS
jgi:hypothetical protein